MKKRNEKKTLSKDKEKEENKEKGADKEVEKVEKEKDDKVALTHAPREAAADDLCQDQSNHCSSS